MDIQKNKNEIIRVETREYRVLPTQNRALMPERDRKESGRPTSP